MTHNFKTTGVTVDKYKLYSFDMFIKTYKLGFWYKPWSMNLHKNKVTYKLIKLFEKQIIISKQINNGLTRVI